ncbi:MAG: chemotaxis protein CheW [Cellulosilyticaceae bacterium]
MDMSQYLELFIEESKENLQSLNEHLLHLEHDPTDMQILNEIFRVAHTLKGMAGTMGFTRMQKLTHNIENVLSEIRNGKIHVNSEMLDILFQCLDALENYVEKIVNTSQEGDEDYAHLVDQLARIGSLEQVVGQQAPQAPQESEHQGSVSGVNTSSTELILLPEAQMHIKDEAIRVGMNVYQVIVTLSASCVLKSARAFVIFNELEHIGEIIHTVPETQSIEDEQFDQSFTLVVVTNESMDKLKSVVMGVVEVESASVTAFVMDGVVSEHAVVEEHKTPQQVEADQPAEAKGANKQQVSSKSVRVSIERLDTLMNLVSELIIVKTQLEGIKGGESNQGTHTNYNDSIEYLERVTNSLHDAVMKVRMVPVESVFNRFPRMIRDVSRKLGKDIDLVMSGEETELDRTVIDEIGDPLIHLLRNAADHGLETTQERINAGKNPKGTIRLDAYQDGNSVVIEVSDDGRGINVNRIKDKAVKKGDITPDVAASMSDQEIIDLLFKPSFSMAEAVTDLSGRGVGLDVVKSKIVSLGGHVEVKTELGKGSKFIVRLPLTLAIIQALMVNISDEKYAIPLSNIQNIEDIRKEDIKRVQKQEVIVLRNEVIPIVRLHSVLDVEEQEKEHMMAVIVKKGEKQIGFIIDSLIGQQEIVIKPLGKYLSHINMIAGATILGNGEVALILDVNTLV